MPDKIEDATIIPPVATTALAIKTTVPEFMTCADMATELSLAYKDILPDMSTKEGRDATTEHWRKFRTVRLALDKAKPVAKSELQQRLAEMEADYKTIRGVLSGFEDKFKGAIDEYETKKEREKAEKEAADTLRKANIQELIARVRSIPTLPLSDSASIAACIEQTSALAIDPQTFMEFSDEAELAKIVALNSLNSLLNAAQVREDEQRKIEADRAELDELRAKQADMQRQLDEANALEQKRLDDEKANMERINGHKEGIANIKSWAGECVGVSSDRVARLILDSRMTESLISSGVYEEFEQEAETARIETLEKMEVIKAVAEKGEKIERERYEEETARQREAEEKQKKLDRIAEEERLTREKKANEEKAAAELKAKEAEKARKISEKAKMLAEAKCKDAATAFKKILDICKDEDLSDKEARNMAALLSEANI